MDMKNALLAFVLSFIILFGWQYFFPAPEVQQTNKETPQAQTQPTAPDRETVPAPQANQGKQIIQDIPEARDIKIDTPLYSMVIDEQGGGVKHFLLKQYRQENNPDSPPVELVKEENIAELPIQFSLAQGNESELPLYKADKDSIILTKDNESATLKMVAQLDGGLEVVRTMTFHPDSYLVDMDYQVRNKGKAKTVILPALALTGKPGKQDSKNPMRMARLFHGTSAYVDNQLHEVKGKQLAKEGTKNFQGEVSWAGYGDNYFLMAMIPTTKGKHSVTMSGSEDKARVVLSEGALTLAPETMANYTYKIFFGPKKLTTLKEHGYDLVKAIHLGMFDILAKPMLWTLNFFHNIFGNYGVAIILVTILIKLIFWPITNKGMKSMKNMQKLQPKITKLREKYKNDPTKMNQEMMALYKTYKINPLGGCLPMLIQIPFFFALYKVLLSSIELRHAPFMLWINDLSAPDRLMISGVDIPFVHGIPVLTLLMGASMYFQMKTTPTTVTDPTQAKIMQFLPVVFTFMFLNFASGLVLYWFTNNLLSIAQQRAIHKQTTD